MEDGSRRRTPRRPGREQPREVPAERLLGRDPRRARPRYGRARWPWPRMRVQVLDVARSRADLAEHGLRVPDLTRLADALADGARLAARGGRARAALPHLQRHLHVVEVPAPYVRLVVRAERAATDVWDSEVWRTTLFDRRAVRVDLAREVELVRSRINRLTSITTEVPPEQPRRRWLPRPAPLPRDPALAAAAREIQESTERRVAALEAYRDQVVACDRELARLSAAESAELNADRLTDLLVDAGADRLDVEHLQQRTAESRLALEGLRHTLLLMSETSTRLHTGADPDVGGLA